MRNAHTTCIVILCARTHRAASIITLRAVTWMEYYTYPPHAQRTHGYDAMRKVRRCRHRRRQRRHCHRPGPAQRRQRPALGEYAGRVVARITHMLLLYALACRAHSNIGPPPPVYVTTRCVCVCVCDMCHTSLVDVFSMTTTRTGENPGERARVHAHARIGRTRTRVQRRRTRARSHIAFMLSHSGR